MEARQQARPIVSIRPSTWSKGLCYGSRTRHVAFRGIKSSRYPYLGCPYNSLELRASDTFWGVEDVRVAAC